MSSADAFKIEDSERYDADKQINRKTYAICAHEHKITKTL